MTQSSIPTPETRRRLVNNLRQTRLELQEFGLQLEGVLAVLEQDIREQKSRRLKKTQEKCDVL